MKAKPLQLKPHWQKVWDECVTKGSFIDRLLRSLLSQPKRFQWASYYRSLKRIPKSSPVYGVRSWKRINERRHEVIMKTLGKPESECGEEFHALQAVDVKFSGDVVSSFILSRKMRRLEARLGKLPTNAASGGDSR